jgi:ABC-type Fe3+ transport system permease subunit
VIASAFAVVFGIFVAALVVLCGIIVTWAVRRDRANWREWRQRHDD